MNPQYGFTLLSAFPHRAERSFFKATQLAQERCVLTCTTIHDLLYSPTAPVTSQLIKTSPRRPDETRHEGAFVLVHHVHDAGRLKALLDPVALLQIVDEHELDSDVPAVDGLGEHEAFSEQQCKNTHAGSGGDARDVLATFLYRCRSSKESLKVPREPSMQEHDARYGTCLEELG